MTALTILLNDGDPYPIGANASKTLAVDFTPWNPTGGSVTGGTCTLSDETTNTDYAAGLSGAASVSGGTALAQRVHNLTAGHSYSLEFRPTFSNGDVDSAYLPIVCPGIGA